MNVEQFNALVREHQVIATAAPPRVYDGLPDLQSTIVLETFGGRIVQYFPPPASLEEKRHFQHVVLPLILESTPSWMYTIADSSFLARIPTKPGEKLMVPDTIRYLPQRFEALVCYSTLDRAFSVTFARMTRSNGRVNIKHWQKLEELLDKEPGEFQMAEPLQARVKLHAPPN